ADRTADLIRTVRAGDLERARTIHEELIPVTERLLRSGTAAANTKAALADLGIIPHPSVRLPLVEAKTA
ncbi:dihydrodipicolinate synthase family protein, partial [Amycolatopsis mediterranei]